MTSLSTKAIIFYNLKDVNNVNYKIMKRRSALQKIAWVSGGIAMLPFLLLKRLDIKRIPNIVEDPNVISSIIVDISIIAQK